MIRVWAPSQLHAYTGGQSRLEATGGRVDEALRDLDRRYPGLRFRIVDEQDRVRPHIRIFIGRRETRDLAAPLAEGDELMIFGALSGG